MSTPFVLVLLGVVIVLLGLGLASLALYLSASVETAGGSGGELAFGEILHDFLVVLFDGGAITLGGGSVLMLIGGVFVVRSPRR